MGTAGGPSLFSKHPGFLKCSFLTMVFQTLCGLGFLPPRFGLTSPHLFLCTSSSVPPPSHLSHTGSFPAYLPKLQICSSLSRWFRAEMRKKPLPPLPLALMLHHPTLFRFKSKM